MQKIPSFSSSVINLFRIFPIRDRIRSSSLVSRNSKLSPATSSSVPSGTNLILFTNPHHPLLPAESSRSRAFSQVQLPLLQPQNRPRISQLPRSSPRSHQHRIQNLSWIHIHALSVDEIPTVRDECTSFQRDKAHPQTKLLPPRLSQLLDENHLSSCSPRFQIDPKGLLSDKLQSQKSLSLILQPSILIAT